MTKRVRIETPAIKTWDDLDQVLREWGEAGIDIEAIEGRADKAINEIKAAAAAECAPLQEKRARLEMVMQQFTEVHRDDLKKAGKKKTKTLVFGQVGFRASTRVIKLEPDDEIIARLKALGHGRLVKVKESVTLNDIKTLPEEVILEAGCELQKLDAFWVEPDRAKIEEARG